LKDIGKIVDGNDHPGDPHGQQQVAVIADPENLGRPLGAAVDKGGQATKRPNPQANMARISMRSRNSLIWMLRGWP
jgi:hypothetical protein